MRKILNSSDSRQIALETITEMAAVVKTTLGPRGRPIILQQTGQNPDGTAVGPLVTKDGVTVAEHVSFRNSAKNTIAQTIVQVAKNTVNSAGDGPQPLHSKILTPRGFVSMRDAHVGMRICGTNGSIQQVLGVFAKGEREICEVEFETGKIVECCADHLWSVVDCSNGGKARTLTTQEMYIDYVKSNKLNHNRFKYYVPNTYVEFDQINDDMPLDPYLVGVLLGDGSLSGTGSIELSIGKNKEHIISKLKLPNGISAAISYVESKNYFRIKLNGKTPHGKDMQDILQSIGLLGTLSKSKFIPKSYLYSSKQTREAVLCGLLDTDGYINIRGRFEFSSVSKELAENFVELASSLGKSVSKRLYEKTEDSHSYSTTPIYRITELKGNTYGDKIVRISPTSKMAQMQCIKVSNADSLYITDGYAVTHNTTTAVVLAEAMYRAGCKHILNGANEIQLFEDLKVLRDSVIKDLENCSVPIKASDLYDVALISANGDVNVAKVVSEGVQAVGEDGHIDIQDGFSRETTLEIVEGAMYKKGWRNFSPSLGYLMVNNKMRNMCELDNPAILIYAGEIKTVQEVSDVLERIWGKTEDGSFSNVVPTLLIAYDFSDDAKNIIIQLRTQMKLPLAAIKAPFDGSPNARTQMLEDLAVMLGGQVTARGIVDLNKVSDEHLGCAGRVEIGPNETVFFDGHGKEEDIIARVKDLKQMLSEQEHEFDKGNIRLRIGKLTGGIAVIRAGGDTELEVKERKDRIEDSLCAAKVAMAEGIIPGGGIALYNISKKFNNGNVAELVMREALQAPIRQIITNTGKHADVVLSLMPDKMGYDARANEYKDMMRSGIVDPLKVTKSALENAVSIVGLLLTTGGAIVMDQESKEGLPNPIAGLMG